MAAEPKIAVWSSIDVTTTQVSTDISDAVTDVEALLNAEKPFVLFNEYLPFGAETPDVQALLNAEKAFVLFNEYLPFGAETPDVQALLNAEKPFVLFNEYLPFGAETPWIAAEPKIAVASSLDLEETVNMETAKLHGLRLLRVAKLHAEGEATIARREKVSTELMEMTRRIKEMEETVVGQPFFEEDAVDVEAAMPPVSDLFEDEAVQIETYSETIVDETVGLDVYNARIYAAHNCLVHDISAGVFERLKAVLSLDVYANEPKRQFW
jgi:hypothetical protein